MAETETTIVPSVETKTTTEKDKPWMVIIYDDPVNLMDYVTKVIQRVFGYSRDKAEQMMLDVHHRGKSLVWSGGRERAELYVEQLHHHQLLAEMHQD
jgi:ATP-dependent Clp protease adaptor protein ClpS